MVPNSSQKTSLSDRAAKLLLSPLAWLCAVLIVLVILLSLPLTIPIGAMYWDTYLYLDAAQRIAVGQVPNVDFQTPVGPLGYYLFAWGLALFPKAQPLLLAQWSTLVIAAPLFAIALVHANSRSRSAALALCAGFVIFATAPVNIQFYNALPSLDGFGIYNRQGVLLLYVLASTFMFVKNGRLLAIACAAIMLALFLAKVTAFLAGGMFCLLALLSGRISIVNALITAALFAAALAILEVTTGLTTAYVADIIQLATMNTESLLPRFRTVITNKFDFVLPATAMVLLLAWIDWKRMPRPLRLLDSSTMWFAIAVLGGIVFETQNTGSQEFIFVWPVLLMIWLRMAQVDRGARTAFIVVAAFCVIPSATTVVNKTARAVAVMPVYASPDATALRNIGQVSTRKDFLERARLLDIHYAQFPDAYRNLADHNQLPSSGFFNEVDNQMQWVLSANDLMKAFGNFEAGNGLRIESLMTLDFTDPFPWLLDRRPTPHIQIGGDPTRTIGTPDAETLDAIRNTDGVLRAKCPLTWARDRIEAIYAPALKGRRVIALNPCWDILLRADLPGLDKVPGPVELTP